jgi:hypothetical protein
MKITRPLPTTNSHAAAARHDHRNGGRLLVGAASAASAGAPTRYALLRADEALTIGKDQHRANASVWPALRLCRIAGLACGADWR